MSTTPDRLEPRWTRPEVALVTCAGGDGSPPNIAGWHDHLADVEVCTPAPPLGPGQSKRMESGPDRLSPHRSSSLRCVATNRDTSSMEKRYPNPDGSRTFCRELVDPTAGEAAASGRFRATSEPTGDMEDNPTKPGGTSTSRTDLLTRSPLPSAPLARAARLPGPPLAFPREGVRDWPHPRCLPS